MGNLARDHLTADRYVQARHPQVAVLSFCHDTVTLAVDDSSGLPDPWAARPQAGSPGSLPSSAVAGHTSLKPIIFLTRPREPVPTAVMGSRSARRECTGRGTAPSFSLNTASGEAGRVMPIS